MRKWILWLHIHGMLLCTSYLLLFGVSSLLYNHPFEWTRPKPEIVRWQRPAKVEPEADKIQAAEGVTRELGLFGWVLPWQTKRDADGTLRYGLSRPGKEYTIEVPGAGGPVRVEERRTGIWQVLRQLHGLMGVRGSTFMVAWAQYTRLCTIVVIFAAISGVYLFATRKSERAIAWVTLGAAAVVTVFMMAYVTISG